MLDPLIQRHAKGVGSTAARAGPVKHRSHPAKRVTESDLAYNISLLGSFDLWVRFQSINTLELTRLVAARSRAAKEGDSFTTASLMRVNSASLGPAQPSWHAPPATSAVRGCSTQVAIPCVHSVQSIC